MALLIAAAVLSAGPGQLDALNAALAIEQQGDDARALAALDRLVQAQPLGELSRLEAARLRLKRGEQLDRAELDADVARSLAPENPRAHYVWALICDERGRPGEAERSLRTAIALRADFADAQFRLGGLLLLKNDFEGAAAAYRAFLARSPEAGGARLQLATALERSGDVRAAEAELRGLCSKAATRLVATRRLADLLEKYGRSREAVVLRASLNPRPRVLRALPSSAR